MKNNGLRRLLGLLAVIFVGNLFSMKMTERGKEHIKAHAQKVMTQLKQEQQTKLEQEREKQFQPGKYFVYEQGTSKGILVDQKLLEDNSEMVKSMVEDFGGRPQEIPVPFSLDDIKLAFNVMSKKINVEKLSPDQLVSVINCYDYLLVDAFSAALINAIFIRVNDIGNKIMKREAIPDYTVFGKIRDPKIVKIIIDKLLSTKNNFCEWFTSEDNDVHGREYESHGSGWDAVTANALSVKQVFQGLTSINAILDKVKSDVRRFDQYYQNRKEEYKRWEEKQAKKWFWQQ